MTPPSAADLAGLIVAMDQRGSLSAIRERLAAGEDPRGLMEECRAGMEQVGKMYESGEYFVSALIMAGEIFRQAADMLLPLMTAVEQPQDTRKVVIATVRGDIHDIGKNIAVTRSRLEASRSSTWASTPLRSRSRTQLSRSDLTCSDSRAS